MQNRHGELTIVCKAKDLVNHTLQLTNNTKLFPKKVRFTLCQRMQNLSIQILHDIIAANEIYPRSVAEMNTRLDRLRDFMREYYRKHGSADGWVLKADVRHYFASIRHDILKRDVNKLLTDPRSRALSDAIIDSTPGNVGIPIGNQSSQVYALLYLNELDHYVKEVLRMRYYGRYMDDFYIICESKEALREAWRKVEQLLAPSGLELNQKTQIFPLRNGLDFLGFHTYLTDTGKVIRKVRRSSKDRMRRKLRKYAVMYENGAMTRKQIEESYQSWRSHASHGQCRELITKYDAVCASIFERSVKSNHAAENQRPTRKGESAGHKD